MTGLLAFDNGLKRRRTSTGTFGLPKSLTRNSQSLNAKYGRMLGSTQSIRSGKGSTTILAEVGTQFRLNSEERKAKGQRDDAEIYRKLGIKAPVVTGRDLHGGIGVMDKLERYRLRNIPPPRGDTPPVQLDEKLRKILYPSPPPPAPLTPTPPPIQLLSEHYYPNGSRIGLSAKAAHPQPSQKVEYRQYQIPVLSQAYHQPPQAVTAQVQGWIFTPQNGWIFIPSTPPYPSPHHGYPPIPPPPPHIAGYPAQTAYPSPYSEVSAGSEVLESPQGYPRPDEYFRPATPEQAYLDPRYLNASNYPETPVHTHTRSFPKGILRDSSSEASGHGRSVKFRDTPDYAYPEMYAQEVAPPICSPPQWQLRKPKQATRIPGAIRSAQSADGEKHQHEVTGVMEIEQGIERYDAMRITQHQEHHYQDFANGEDERNRTINGSSGRPAVSLEVNQQASYGVPTSLAAVHRQLVSSHDVDPGVSGKRTGRDLVRNLESLAELQNEGAEQPDGNSPASPFPYNQPTTPHRPGDDRQLQRAVPTRKFSLQSRDDYDPEDRHEQHGSPDARPSNDFEPTTPRKNASTTRTHQNRSETQTSHQIDLAVRHEMADSQEEMSEHPEQADPLRALSNSPRKVPTKNRLPPPSQNWHESQRPLMTFSQNESILSQDRASQNSMSQSQEVATKSSGKKRERQEWRDDEDEDDEVADHAQEASSQDFEHRSNQGGGSPSQETHQYSQSPDRHSQPAHHYFQAQSFRTKNGQANQQRNLSQSSQPTSREEDPSILRKSPQRHRLTDVQDLPDIDDPSDYSYRPTSTAAEEDEDLEYDNSEPRSRSISQDSEPGAKRIKITEGAWAKYDIPQDRVPIPPPTHVPFLQTYNKSRFSHLNKKQDKSKMNPRNEVNDENIKSSQTQSQSQISQIESPDDEMDMSWIGEDIDGSWSQGYSEKSGRGSRAKKQLSTISEGEEEEEEEVGQGQESRGNGAERSRVVEGFFGDGGDAGFTVWRDRY